MIRGVEKKDHRETCFEIKKKLFQCKQIKPYKNTISMEFDIFIY